MLDTCVVSRKSFLSTRVVTACAVILSASAGLTATQDNTLTLGEITGDQVAGFSGQQPYFWSPKTSFRSPNDVSGDKLLGQRDGSSATGFLTVEQKNAGFVWDPVLGKVVLIGQLGVEGNVLATDVAGNILAGWQQTSAAGRHAFIWSSGIGLQNLNEVIPTPEGVTLTEAVDISSSGAIIGQWINEDGKMGGFFWVPGSPIQFLPSNDTGRSERPKAVSPLGHVIGQTSLDDEDNLGYIWHDDTITQYLEAPDGSSTEALGVNSIGDVTGTTGLGTSARALLWPAGSSEAIDLNTRLSRSLAKELKLIRAEAINDAGQIAAYGLSKTGNVHLILLTPEAEGQNYVPQGLGEIYVDIAAQPLSGLGINDIGEIFGSCAPLAQACPSFASLQPQQELAQLDGVTNLFVPGNSGEPQRVLSRLSPAAAFATDPATVVAGNLGESGSLPSNRGPESSTPFFPPISLTSASTVSQSAAVAPIPLPSTVWAMLLGVFILLRLRGTHTEKLKLETTCKKGRPATI